MQKATLAPDRNETEYSFEYKGDVYLVLRSGVIIGGEYSSELEELLKHYRSLHSSYMCDGIYKFAEALNVKLTDYIDRSGIIY